MASSVTFSSLKTRLKEFLEDDSTEYDSELPSIIGRAQDMVQLSMDLSVFYSTQTGTMSDGESTISRPSTALTIKFIHLTDDNIMMEERDLAYCKLYTSGSVPKYFSDLDSDTIFIAPPNSGSRNYDLRFMERLASIDDTNTSNWISSYAGDLLFQACIIESEAFLKDAGRKDMAEKDFARLFPVVMSRVRHMVNANYDLPMKGGK